MGDEVRDMIDAAKNNDGAAFKAAVDTVLSQKVGDALQTQKQEIAKNTFGNIRVPSAEGNSESES